MLSRSAENLFWLARYTDRAEATARLLEMGRRMALVPGPTNRDDWRSVVRATGAEPLLPDNPHITEADVVTLLLLASDNPSSIRSSLTSARANAKAVRTALTQRMWETLNDGWRFLDNMDERTACRDLDTIIDWVITRAATFRGATEASMLRDDRYDFLRLGWFLERADTTLRLLNVKYYILLPEYDVVGGGRDHHQWTSLLQALSGIRAYHHSYNGDYSPWQIADFLLRNKAFPRSLAFCYTLISHHLESLAERYGQRHDCQATINQALHRILETEPGEIFRSGLHEFINDAISLNARLSQEITAAYHFDGT